MFAYTSQKACTERNQIGCMSAAYPQNSLQHSQYQVLQL